MKRPLFAIGVSWFFVTWLAFFCGGAALQMSFAALLTALMFFLLRNKNTYAYAACIVMMSSSVAFASFWLYERRIEPVLSLKGVDAVVEGLITDAEYGIRGTTYTVKASFPEYPRIPGTILVVRDFSGMEISAGDTVRFNAGLDAAPSSSWYRSRGILLTGMSPKNTEGIPAGKYRAERALMRLRVLLTRNVYSNLKEENADIISAMVLGQKNNIPPEIYSALGKSGTSHLLTVSGLHLSILSAAVFALLKKIKLPAPAAALATIVSGFLFSALVGFGAPVSRAFIMTAVALLAQHIFLRQSDSLSSLGLALLVCCIFSPHWALGWGLWLSSASTLGIVLYGSRISGLIRVILSQKTKLRDNMCGHISNALGISAAAYTFTMPLLFLMSGWISLVSPLANLLVSPFVSVAIIGGVICALFPPSSVVVAAVAAVTDASVSFTVSVSERLGSLPFAIFAMDESWILIFFLGICAIVPALAYFRADKQLLSYALALIAVCFCAGDLSLMSANRGKVELVTLDGRNAAVLLRGDEAVVLGAPDAYEISNLLKYLTFRGVKAIPAIIATDSPDNADSGLLRLSRAYPVDCVIAPNDVYVEESLARAMPESVVYSGGYAEINVLGIADVTPAVNGEDIHIKIGSNEIVKIRRECDIIDSQNDRIQVFDKGKMLLPRNTVPLFEPLGAFLFGESRILIGG